MRLPSEWEERARLEAMEALVVPDAMCLYGNPWHFLMKTKLLHAPSLLLSWPNFLLCYRHMWPLLERSHVGLARPYPSPLLYTILSCFLLKKHGGLPLLLQKSPVWGGGEPVKGTEKLMQYRLGA